MKLINVENLTFTYPNEASRALSNVSFSINEGDFCLVFGKSGCGKTTLFRQLKRELAPHGEKCGNIYYRGKLQEELSDREAAGKIGFVLQNPESQIVMDKVWHELAFGLENMGVSQKVIRSRVGEMANFFGIHQWFHKKTAELSGGQKQLLNLASVLLMQPELIILDEPTSQLDPIAAADFLSILKKLNRELGITILISEHRLEEVFPMADKVIIMEDGELLMEDSPRNIGARLKEIHQSEELMKGLPSAMRIFHSFAEKDACPMTVREGRAYLQKRFHQKITSISQLDVKNGAESATEDDVKIASVTGDCKKKNSVKGLRNSQQPVISLENVWFRYKKELPDVLSGTELDVYAGEIVSILGGNGSGKTTLLSVIAGGAKAYRGTVCIHGKKMKEYKNGSLYRNNLALLPQDPKTVFVKQTVREDYVEIRKVMTLGKEEFAKKIEEVASLLSITHLLDKHPYDLSGGEQQKCALGKMLLLNPKILLLDEPTKGIDAASKYHLGELLKKLAGTDVTVLMVTHDVEFSAEVSDRCGLFFDGNMTSLDTPVEFFKGNTFYTTAANRLSKAIYEDAITCEDVITLCKENGVKV